MKYTEIKKLMNSQYEKFTTYDSMPSNETLIKNILLNQKKLLN